MFLIFRKTTIMAFSDNFMTVAFFLLFVSLPSTTTQPLQV